MAVRCGPDGREATVLSDPEGPVGVRDPGAAARSPDPLRGGLREDRGPVQRVRGSGWSRQRLIEILSSRNVIRPGHRSPGSWWPTRGSRSAPGAGPGRRLRPVPMSGPPRRAPSSAPPSARSPSSSRSRRPAPRSAPSAGAVGVPGRSSSPGWSGGLRRPGPRWPVRPGSGRRELPEVLRARPPRAGRGRARAGAPRGRGRQVPGPRPRTEAALDALLGGRARGGRSGPWIPRPATPGRGSRPRRARPWPCRSRARRRIRALAGRGRGPGADGGLLPPGRAGRGGWSPSRSRPPGPWGWPRIGPGPPVVVPTSAAVRPPRGWRDARCWSEAIVRRVRRAADDPLRPGHGGSARGPPRLGGGGDGPPELVDVGLAGRPESGPGAPPGWRGSPGP